MNPKILLIFAHPDDESFSAGGTIAKYVDHGSTVNLVCITRGQAGNRGPYDSKIDVGAIRSQELEAAAKILGISSVTFLDYEDGKVAALNPGELEEKLYKILLTEVPDIVITFEPNGVSNHPDHKKLSLSATFAFQKYATHQVRGEKIGQRDPRRAFVHSIPPAAREEPKLYYVCMPEGVASFLKKNNVIPEESFGSPWIGVADKKVTTCIDISEYTETKLKALAQHKTQFEDVERYVSIDNQPLMYKEYFIFRMQGEQEIFMGKGDEVSSEL